MAHRRRCNIVSDTAALRAAGRRMRAENDEEGYGWPVKRAFATWLQRSGFGYPQLDAATHSAALQAFKQGWRGKRRRNPDSAFVQQLYAAGAKARRPLPDAGWEQRAQETAARMAKRYSTRGKAAGMAFEHSMDYPTGEEEWLFWRRVSNLLRAKRRSNTGSNGVEVEYTPVTVQGARHPSRPRRNRGRRCRRR